MKKRSWVLGAAGAVCTAAALGWAFAPRPVSIETATVQRGAFESAVEEDAKTRVRDRYLVAAPLSGRLVRIALREGDVVEEGAVVATLTPAIPPLLDNRARREHELRVAIARANVDRVQARILRARVAVDQAEHETLRTEQLARQGFVSPSRLDTDRLALLASQREFQAAQEERHVAEREVAQARVALEATRRPAEDGLFHVRAPVAGRVLHVLQSSETTVPLGAPLIELGDTTRLEVVAELLTTDALQVQPGMPVSVERWGGDRPLAGRVRAVEPGAFTKVSALGVEEQRVRVLIDLAGPPTDWQRLGDGYRVTVRIITRSVDAALRVPVSAVFPQAGAAGGFAVFLVRDGRAVLTPVTVAARNASEAWIGDGLAPGTLVVVYPPPAVIDGRRVSPRGRARRRPSGRRARSLGLGVLSGVDRG